MSQLLSIYIVTDELLRQLKLKYESVSIGRDLHKA